MFPDDFMSVPDSYNPTTGGFNIEKTKKII
jgi:hypothetical protein